MKPTPGHYFCDTCNDVAFGPTCRTCNASARFVPEPVSAVATPPRSAVAAPVSRERGLALFAQLHHLL